MSSSGSEESAYSDISVNSGYDSDVVAIPDVPAILLYQFEPAARENIANEPNLAVGVVRGNRAGTTTW